MSPLRPASLAAFDDFMPSAPVVPEGKPVVIEATSAPSPSKKPQSLPESGCCTLSTESYDLYSILHLTEGSALTPVQRVKALATLEKDNPALADLYEHHVVCRLKVTPEKRAAAIVALVAHLHRAVSASVAKQLLSIEWQLNRAMYNGSMREHLDKIGTVWTENEAKYVASLSPEEVELWESFGQDAKDAFRITRDLAIAGKGSFFMGYNQLAKRIGTHCNGHRLLKKFGSGGWGIIETIEEGLKWQKGVKPRAGSYRWLLPLPAVQAVDQPAAA